VLGLLTRCDKQLRRLSEVQPFESFLRQWSLRPMALVGYGAHAGLVPEMQVDLDKFGSNHSLGATVEQATRKASVLSANVGLARLT
jgi:hypothetical protein